MINKTMLAAAAALSMLGMGAAAQADESDYRVLQPVSVTGSAVTVSDLPIPAAGSRLG